MVEREIIDWVNNKLASAGKTTSIRSFQDGSIADARVIIDLVDAIKPGIINYEVVKDTHTEEVLVLIHFKSHLTLYSTFRLKYTSSI